MRAVTENPAHSAPMIGLLSALAAYLTWGLSPLYFKVLQAIPAFEILMHRMIWSFLFLLLLVLIRGQWSEFFNALKTARTVCILVVTTLLVALNWFLFIWAINQNHVLQTSLGYYISPLISVLLGLVFLRERLRPLQILAVVLAAAAVLNLIVMVGEFPWVSLTLAVTFGLYGLIRKVAPVGALVGLTIETMLLTGPAVAYLVYIDRLGRGTFFRVGASTDLLLMAAALVTALPLLLFTVGARRLHLSTIGFLQYIAPTCTFFLAVFLWHEPLETFRLGSFAMIWVALAIFSTDSAYHYRSHRVQPGREARGRS